MNNPSSSRDVSRRGFITDVAVGATGAIALSAILPSEARASDQPGVPAAEWDLTWIDRLTGKYRTVFDAPEVNDGMVFTNASVFMMGFKEVYNVLEGFEGPLDDDHHRGTQTGWRFDGLPWEQL